MATFFYNRFSHESYKSQWQRYIQNQSFADDITKSVGQQTNDFSVIISSQTREIQDSINSASNEQKLAIQESTKAVCGTLSSGFELISNNLNEISFGIENVRYEINEMASMLDWNFSLVIEQQKISNILLGNIGVLLRIPDIQKERQYYIEQGLKFFKNACFDNDMYDDALNNFIKAESIEHSDYFTLHRIGMIYLHSPKLLDIEKAEDYFKKAAKYAIVESHEGACISKNDLNEFESKIGDIKLQAAESYLFASRCCYIQGKFEEAAILAGNSYRLVPDMVEAGFTQAKALSAAEKISDAIMVLKSVIETDRFFSIKVLSDFDLNSKKEVNILLEELRNSAISQLDFKVSEIKNKLNIQSDYRYLIDRLENYLSKNNYLNALAGLDILKNEYCWTIKNFLYNEFSHPCLHLFNTYRVCEIKFITSNVFEIILNNRESIDTIYYDCHNNKIIEVNQIVPEPDIYDFDSPIKIENFQVWNKRNNKLLIQYLIVESEEWRRTGKCKLSVNGSYLITSDDAGDEFSNFPERVFLWKRNVIAPNNNIIGTFETYVVLENENLKKIEEYENEKKEFENFIENERQKKIKEQKIKELLFAAQNEEEQQKTKWFKKNFNKALTLYKMAAELGDEIAKQKIIELSK